jgi:L-malate glycosyltransferase
LHVLHLTLSSSEGGRKQAITTLLRSLVDEGIACDLACLDPIDSPPQEVMGLVGAYEVIGRRSRGAATDLRALVRLVQFCRQRRVTIIHAHDGASHYFGAMARCFLPSVRLLMTFHRSSSIDTGRLRDRLRNALAITRSDVIVTGSSERREYYLDKNFIRPEKVISIPLGVDTGRFRPDAEVRAAVRRELGVDDETVLLGATGHFGPVKGIDVVLRGFAEAVRNGSPCPLLLVVVGDGTESQRAAVRELAATVSPGQVVFTGFRRDVERWFQAFNVFVHAPRQEAFGLVLAEAMASGLPVVATRVGGVRDIIQEGQTGLLVPSESPDLLAEAICRLAGDRDYRQAMSTAARQVAVNKYNACLYARRYARLYHSLAEGRAPSIADLQETDGPRPVTTASH